MSDLNVSIIMRLVNRLRGPSREARRDLRGIQDQAEQLQRTTARGGRAQERMYALGRVAARGMMLTAGGAALAAGNSVRQAVSMEDAWSEANKTLEMSPDRLAALSDQIDEMSKRIPLARQGLVEIAAQAGQIGIRGSADILAFTEDAAKMASTFDVSAGAAAEMMGSWREQMGYTQDQVRLLADQINYLGNTTAADSASLAAYSAGIMGIAKEAGMAEEPTLALGAAMIASGRAPEVAATGMRALFRTLTKGTADMTAAQNKVLSRVGLEGRWDEIQKQMQTDAAGAVMRVVEALESLPIEERLSAATRLFGEEAARAMGPLLSNTEKLEAAFDRIPAITAAAGSMNAEFAALSDDVADNAAKVRNALAARSSGFGASMLDPINDGLKTLLNLLNTLDERATVFDRFGSAWSGFMSGIGGADGSAVARNLDAISDAVGRFLFGSTDEDAGEVLAKVFQGAERFGEQVRNVSQALKDGATSVGDYFRGLDGFMENLEAVGEKAEPILRNIGRIADAVARLFSAGADSDVTKSALGGLGALIGQMAGIAFETVGKGLEIAANGIAAITGALAALLEGNVLGAGREIKGFFSWLGGFVLPEWVSSFSFRDMFAGINQSEAVGWIKVAFAFRWSDIAPAWLMNFSMRDFLPNIDVSETIAIIKGWFAFEWKDVLPAWRWSDIIPSLPKFSLFGGGDSEKPAVQERASGGSFGPGWLLTGERGPELEFANRSGFIANNAQLRRMVAMSDTVRRNIGRTQPVAVSGYGAGIAQGTGGVHIERIEVHAAPGQSEQDVARAVILELKRQQRAKGNDLHDGGRFAR